VRKTHTAQGTVARIDASTGSLGITHEPVASLNWPAMTMEFKLKDKAMLGGVKAGSRIRFDFTEQAPGEWTILRLDPLASAAGAAKAPAAKAAAAQDQHKGH